MDARLTIFPDLLSFHDGYDRVGEQECPIKVEFYHALPVIQRVLLDQCRRLRDDRAAADRIDQDVDAPEISDDAGNNRVDL